MLQGIWLQPLNHFSVCFPHNLLFMHHPLRNMGHKNFPDFPYLPHPCRPHHGELISFRNVCMHGSLWVSILPPLPSQLHGRTHHWVTLSLCPQIPAGSPILGTKNGFFWCCRASPLAGANHLSCWELPGGEVSADAPAALCWPDGRAVCPCTKQFSSQSCTSPNDFPAGCEFLCLPLGRLCSLLCAEILLLCLQKLTIA